MITTEHCGLDEPYIIILNRYNSIDFHRNGYRYPPSTIQYVILLYANAEPNNNYCRSFSCTRRCECDIRKSSRFGAWEWHFFPTSVFYALLLFYRRRSRCPRAVYRMKNCPTTAAVSHLRHRTGSPLGGDKSASAESHVLDIRTHTYNTCIRIYIYTYYIYTVHTHVHTEANSIMCTQCGPQIAVLERPPLARTKGSRELKARHAHRTAIIPRYRYIKYYNII